MIVALLRGSEQTAALLARQGKTWRFNSGTVPGCGQHHLNRLRTRAVMVFTHRGHAQDHCAINVITPGSLRYATATQGQSKAEVRHNGAGRYSDLQARGQGFESP
jgi:hypothetical protein